MGKSALLPYHVVHQAGPRVIRSLLMTKVSNFYLSTVCNGCYTVKSFPTGVVFLRLRVLSGVVVVLVLPPLVVQVTERLNHLKNRVAPLCSPWKDIGWELLWPKDHAIISPLPLSNWGCSLLSGAERVYFGCFCLSLTFWNGFWGFCLIYNSFRHIKPTARWVVRPCTVSEWQ